MAKEAFVAAQVDPFEARELLQRNLGEPGTQMTMRTFHYAGVGTVNVTQGLQELLKL